MSFPDVTYAVSHWAFLSTLVRLALALGTGAFVGLEREHRGKGGARTFTFASLIGCLGGYGLVQLQETWATVLLIAALGFVNYVLWKIYGPRSIDITSFWWFGQ